MSRKCNSSLLLHCIVVAALSLSANAADGTWKSASAGGNWASADNWVDGVIPGNGGVARFNFSGQTGSLQVQGSGSDTAILSVIDIYCALPSSSNVESYFDQILFNMVAPANIDLKNGIAAFRKNTLSSTSGLLVSGGGRLVLHAPQDISGSLVVSGGWVRVTADSALGSTPAALVPDAIVLDGGILQNGGVTELAATRGVTVRANGGSFAAGYTYAYLKINGPVTGPGEVRIAMESCPVIFTNPANDWDGDLVVGTAPFGDISYGGFKFMCGADEVVPHGAGKGRLRLALGTTFRDGRARFDLAGHVESVNAITSETRGAVDSTTPGGVLKLVSNDDSQFDGYLHNGATMEKYGTGLLAVSGAESCIHGKMVHAAGALEIVPGTVANDGRVVLAGGSATFTSGAAGGTLHGAVELAADYAVDVAAGAGLVFGGRLVPSEGATPTPTFTVNTLDGRPLVVGSSTSQASALVDVDLVCPNGIVVTNYVWLRKGLPANATVSPGTTLTVDYAGAVADNVTLSGTDLRVASGNVGSGTITVPTGRSVLFTTQSISDGEFVDLATGERTFANNVILQGGHLVFDGQGIVYFNGAVSGYGDIYLNASGTVVLANGSGLESGCAVRIYGGTLRVPSTGSLGEAKVYIVGGTLANVAGQDLTLANDCFADGGAVRVDGAGSLVTLTGSISYVHPISLNGDGSLRLAGEKASDYAMHVCGGTLRLAKASAIGYVIGCEPGCGVVLEADGALPSYGQISLSGGTLDMNGHSVAVDRFKEDKPGSLVTNTSSAPARLTVTGAYDAFHTATFADGEGPFVLAFTGAGTNEFSNATLANSGLVVSNGVAKFTGSTAVKAALLRFLPIKARPGVAGPPDHAGTGFQMSEFRLLKDGAPVAWPEGTVSWARYPENQAGNESAPKLIDGSTSTKWYSGNTSNPIIINCGDVVEFDAYQYATGGDAKGRDPISWTLETGTITGSTTNWVVLDSQTDVSNAVPVARNSYTAAFPVAPAEPYAAFPVGYSVCCDANGTLFFDFCNEDLSSLSGGGTLIGVNGTRLALSEGSTFSGLVDAASSVPLRFTGSAIPGMTAAEGTTLVNDGAAGALSFTEQRIYLNQGSYADGTAALGLDVGAGALLMMDGADAAYTGSTRVRSGGVLQVANGLLYARHFRFFPLKGSGGQSKVNMQLSEIELVLNGEGLAWPNGVVATTSYANDSKGEGAQQLVDGLIYGNTGTKCYWGGTVAPVVITLPEVAAFSGYRWYTANDSMNVRNPVSWTFEYSLDGETWTLLDEQTDRETTMQTRTLAYTFELPAPDTAARTALSPLSPVTLDAGGTCLVYRAEESLGALAGSGTLRVVGGVARVNAVQDASFAGVVEGSGAFVKAGAGTETISGDIALAGDLVVEDGVLDLDGATLSGVTNIVLKGGTLVGSATAAGDLKVTCQGGAYAATISVAGRLELAGPFVLGLGGEPPVSRTAFTYGSLAEGSAAVFAAASVAGLDSPNAWQLSCRTPAGSLRYSVQRRALVIILQ
jgi:autotransporter-associated beta strand protein